MTARVLVLGADEFIGSHLVRALADSDWAVPIAAGRQAGLSTERVARIQLNATDEAALSAALGQVDAVANCISGSAGIVARGAKVLFAAAARQPVKPRIMHLSSMAVYGPVSGVVTEASELIADRPYAQSKIDSERDAQAYGPVVILRHGIIYGPGSRQWTERIGRWLYARRIGDLGAAGDGCCNLVYVGDMVDAISAGLRQSESSPQVFNMAMPEAPSWNEYFVAFARALGAVPVKRIGGRSLRIEAKLLAPPLKIAEIIAKKAKLNLSLPEAMPPSLLQLWRQDIRLDSSAASARLGQRWTSLQDGLAQAAAWFNQRCR